MRPLLLLLSIIIFVSCDDGDFEIPSFDFNENINVCGDYVVYRTNTSATEALIITLTNQDIRAEESLAPILVSMDAENLQYRIFDAAVSSNYFCADVPPIEPNVIRNWQGVAGTTNNISIETTAIFDINNDITGYEHTLNLQNLVLESNGETLVFENYYFGSFVTSL